VSLRHVEQRRLRSMRTRRLVLACEIDCASTPSRASGTTSKPASSSMRRRSARTSGCRRRVRMRAVVVAGKWNLFIREQKRPQAFARGRQRLRCATSCTTVEVAAAAVVTTTADRIGLQRVNNGEDVAVRRRGDTNRRARRARSGSGSPSASAFAKWIATSWLSTE